MSEFTLYRGTPHPLDFAGEREKVSDMGPMPHPPRAEAQQHLTGFASLEFAGENVSVPLYELSFGKIDEASARALGGLATHELVVMSRLAERGAVEAGVRAGFAHPAYMDRDAAGRIQRANFAAIPMPAMSYADAQSIRPGEVAPYARRIINCSPDEMLLRTGNAYTAVPRSEQFPWMDAVYAYEILGESNQGVTVARSAIQEVRGAPFAVPGDTLLLAHTEAVLEAARTGVNPDVVSHMVFAVGLERSPEGFQGNTFTGLGYYSARTLRRYLHEVGI